MALVLDSDNHLGFIDERGRKLDFGDLYLREGFSDSLTIASQLDNGRASGKFLLVNHSGKVVANVDQYYVNRFSEGLAAFMERKGWGATPSKSNAPFGHRRGYLDQVGRIVIPARFAYAAPFSEGLAAVASDGQCWVADWGGWHYPAPSAAVQFTSCGPEAAASVVQPCRHGYIDRTGRLHIPERYELAQDFSQERAAVRLGGKWGFIDRSGTDVTAFRFDEVKPFSENRAAVRVGTKWGYIDRSGSNVIDTQFDDALTFTSGLAAAKKGPYYSFINALGAEVIHGPYIHATQFVKGLAHVQIGETKWAWIDRTGKAVFTYDWKQ